VTHLEETIRLNPRSTSPFITLGETLQCLRRYADAERAYQSALRIAPIPMPFSRVLLSLRTVARRRHGGKEAAS